MFDLIIDRGEFALPSGTFNGWAGIKDGRIAALGSGRAPESRSLIDAGGALVLPGGIDPHVHFRDPGRTEKEDFGTGSAAAAAGGVTTVFDMPNTVPAVLTPEVLDEKRRMAERKSYVDFGLFAAVDPENFDHIGDLAAAGAIAFKIFMYNRPNPPPRGITDDGLLHRAFELVAGTGRPACVHAENEAMVRYFTGLVEASGRRDPRAHLAARPAICEMEAVSRAILIAADAGVHLHVCHLSSRDGVKLIREAKRNGLCVTAETGPQQLLLDESDYDRLGALIKMVPPIRTADDAAQLWAGLLDGSVDMLATDHAPHTAEEKRHSDFFKAPSGIIGVETTLPLMLDAMRAGRLTLARLNQVRSEMPARVFGLYPRKGVIQVGADADLVIVDTDREWTIRGEALHSRSRVTPFEGRTVRGAVTMTLVRGRVVYRDGVIVGVPTGQMVRP